MVTGRVGTIDPLTVHAAFSQSEPHVYQEAGCEVNFVVAVCVGVTFSKFEITLMVEHAIKYERSVAIGAFDWATRPWDFSGRRAGRMTIDRS